MKFLFHIVFVLLLVNKFCYAQSDANKRFYIKTGAAQKISYDKKPKLKTIQINKNSFYLITARYLVSKGYTSVYIQKFSMSDNKVDEVKLTNKEDNYEGTYLLNGQLYSFYSHFESGELQRRILLAYPIQFETEIKPIEITHIKVANKDTKANFKIAVSPDNSKIAVMMFNGEKKDGNNIFTLITYNDNFKKVWRKDNITFPIKCRTEFYDEPFISNFGNVWVIKGYINSFPNHVLSAFYFNEKTLVPAEINLQLESRKYPCDYNIAIQDDESIKMIGVASPEIFFKRKGDLASGYFTLQLNTNGKFAKKMYVPFAKNEMITNLYLDQAIEDSTGNLFFNSIIIQETRIESKDSVSDAMNESTTFESEKFKLAKLSANGDYIYNISFDRKIETTFSSDIHHSLFYLNPVPTLVFYDYSKNYGISKDKRLTIPIQATINSKGELQKKPILEKDVYAETGACQILFSYIINKTPIKMTILGKNDTDFVPVNFKL